MSSLEKAIELYEKTSDLKVFSIRPLSENEWTDTFLVNLMHVVRIVKESPLDEPYYTQYGEYYLYRTISDGTYPVPIPHLFYYSPNTQYKVEAYINGIEPFLEPSLVEKEASSIVKAIADLHSLPIKEGGFDPITRYMAYKKASGMSLPAQFEKAVISRVTNIIDSRKPVYCHNHLSKDSVVLSETDGTVLVDFKFGGLNASIFDIASLCEENGFTSVLARRLLNQYSTHSLESPYTYEELSDAILFLDGMWFYYYWAKYKQTGNKKYMAEAKKRRSRFLFSFEGKIMEDADDE